MTQPALMGRDLFIRNTDAAGRTSVVSHRVWNAELFMKAREAEASRMALEPVASGKPPGKNKAERITEDQYHSERRA